MEFVVPDKLDGFDVPEYVGRGVYVIPEDDVIYRPAADDYDQRVRTEP